MSGGSVHYQAGRGRPSGPVRVASSGIVPIPGSGRALARSRGSGIRLQQREPSGAGQRSCRGGRAGRRPEVIGVKTRQWPASAVSVRSPATIAWMLGRHPARLNITTLYSAAHVLAGKEQAGRPWPAPGTEPRTPQTLRRMPAVRSGGCAGSRRAEPSGRTHRRHRPSGRSKSPRCWCLSIQRPCRPSRTRR